MRAKFKCESVTHRNWGTPESPVPAKEVVLDAVYSGDKNKEDNQFSSATPSGKLTMMISNPDPAVQNFFEPGKKYYMDFTEAAQ